MAIFHFFKKKRPEPVLLRCTECTYEYHLSTHEVRHLEKQNISDTICPVKEECHICHIGFMIPVHYIDKNGKLYVFNKIKPYVKNLDPDTLTDRIFKHPDTQDIISFGPQDDIDF